MIADNAVKIMTGKNKIKKHKESEKLKTNSIN